MKAEKAITKWKPFGKKNKTEMENGNQKCVIIKEKEKGKQEMRLEKGTA